MCGRFAINTPVQAMAQLFDAAPSNDLPDLPNYNVCPTNAIHVVLGGEKTAPRLLVSMRWGFIPRWYKKPNDGPLLINARAESIAQKPAFRLACRERRCLIPVSGFYEWTSDAKGARCPWYIHSGETLALAGIWQTWETEKETLRTCAIVTTSANKKMSKIHPRMPVIVSPEEWGLWLGEDGHGAAKIMNAQNKTTIYVHEVDRAVNSNRANGPDLIRRVYHKPKD
ncbi:SOS response-associated peptidase [Pseudopelagicola sp. nBUS_20]|uniref:SOS response-associated peptidase n=1 Tax=Pseudopelagicola sp. nBUS_20 TaxID=3395317 RepID=UPI003EB75E37